MSKLLARYTVKMSPGTNDIDVNAEAVSEKASKTKTQTNELNVSDISCRPQTNPVDPTSESKSHATAADSN